MTRYNRKYIRPNTKVIIKSTNKSGEYKKCIGLCGTVKHGGRTTISVEIEGMYNIASSKGLFWFTNSEVEIINPENVISIESEELNMLDNKYDKVVFVQFVGGCNDYKTRSFAYYGQDVIEGDYVLCDNVTGYTLAKVVEVIVNEEAKEKGYVPTKEVICKCDMSAFNNRKETRAKALKLKAEMDRIIRKMDAENKYDMYAEKNPDLKDMLDEYRTLV